MPSARKTWLEKMQSKSPHTVVLDKSFAGIPKGSKLHISSPMEIASELQKLPFGTTISIQQFRSLLALKNECDATCPVSTSIFLRIVAEHTWEQYNLTGSIENLYPFWRVLDPSSALAKKLSFDVNWIVLQRELEHP